jgi:membrane-associated phospholipid phosphatase
MRVGHCGDRQCPPAPHVGVGGNANFANLPTLGRITAHIVLTLREGRLESIDLRAIDGIISFPSLHASVAVIVPFTLRWNKLLFWPIVVLDGLMMVSAVPSGNHYLSDVVGGIAVAALAILSARPIHASLTRLFVAATISHIEGPSALKLKGECAGCCRDHSNAERATCPIDQASFP